MAAKVRVLLVDSQLLYRDGLSEIMSRWPDFEVVGAVSSAREAIAFARRTVFDLVISDVRLPDGDGVETMGVIRRIAPKAKVVFLTLNDRDEVLLRAAAIGAAGYILKDVPSRRLKSMLIDVSKGEGALSSAMARTALVELGRGVISPARRAKAADYNLDEQSVEMLRLVARGYSNDEIGEQMFISTGTVKKQLGMLMRNLECKNRVQLAVSATKMGLGD